MKGLIRERRAGSWGLPRRVVHKLYRMAYETPTRKRIASSVLTLPPSPPVDADLPFTVHMLVCRRDATMAICTAKVANLAFDMALPWVFHDDGSLSEGDEKAFRMSLPGCTVVRRSEADRVANEKLAAYPEILKYREHQVMALKLVDVKLWSRGGRLAYIDSDILFFRKPDFLLEALSGERRKNFFNRDISDSYVRAAEDIGREVGVRPLDRLNAGLWVMHDRALDLDTIEQWLQHPAFRENVYDYTLDQTFISMLANSSPSGVEHLPPAYDVAYRKDVTTSPNKHYVGAIRHGYELEGLRYLLSDLEFARRWKDFSSWQGDGPAANESAAKAASFTG